MGKEEEEERRRGGEEERRRGGERRGRGEGEGAPETTYCLLGKREILRPNKKCSSRNNHFLAFINSYPNSIWGESAYLNRKQYGSAQNN